MAFSVFYNYSKLAKKASISLSKKFKAITAKTGEKSSLNPGPPIAELLINLRNGFKIGSVIECIILVKALLPILIHESIISMVITKTRKFAI